MTISFVRSCWQIMIILISGDSGIVSLQVKMQLHVLM